MSEKAYEKRMMLASTDKKLLPYYKDIMERKGPFHIQLMPTNNCNLKCEFCAETDKNNGACMTVEYMMDIVDKFPDLLSVEITGGGEPTIYKDLPELITQCWKRKLKIGIVTNGYRLQDIKEQLPLLMWLRISVNGFIDKGMKIDFDCIPPNLKFGISYIVWKGCPENYMDKLKELKKKYPNIRYIRIAGDVTDKQNEDKFIDYGDNIYFIHKAWKKSTKNCYAGSVRCILAPNGYLFPCCVVSLKEGIYNPEQSVTVNQIKNYVPFKCPFEECIFSDRNEFIEQALMHCDDNIEFI